MTFSFLVNVVNNKGFTPLFLSSQENHTPCVKNLLLKGGVTNSKINGDLTIAHAVSYSGALSAAQILLLNCITSFFNYKYFFSFKKIKLNNNVFLSHSN